MQKQFFIFMGLLFGLVLAVSWSGSGRVVKAQPTAVDTDSIGQVQQALQNGRSVSARNDGLSINGADWLLSGTLFGGITSRVSVASDGSQGNGTSWDPSISGDGRYVAFWSWATNLVPGDANEMMDVFVHDRQTGQTSLISVASDGTQGNNPSDSPSVSGDGRYVAFGSQASNLVPNDVNGLYDVFVRDRQTGQTSLISVASDGSQGNHDTWNPSISADGRYIAFQSEASNLVPGDTNASSDVFVHDHQTGQTSLVSVASDGTQGEHDSGFPSISADSRYVAFQSESSTLVPGDSNGYRDIFVHDRQTGETGLVSVASDGSQGSDHAFYPSISVDGRYIAFESFASNLVPGDTNDYSDIFVHDRLTGETSLISVAWDGSQGDGHSTRPSISVNGRYVAFESFASNLVPGDLIGKHVFLHDRLTGETTLVSVAWDGSQEGGHAFYPSISADGRYVAFNSSSGNLVPGDTNGYEDIFVRDHGDSQAFIISGRVGDINNNPIAEVTVTTDAGHSTTTDTNGNYTILGLITGTYTITPALAGYTFSPPFRTATVPPDAVGQDFTGTFANVDLGFRPNTDGYSFENWGGSELTVQHLVAMFGEEAVCRFSSGSLCVPKWGARRWLAKMNVSMLSGHSFGMTHTAQRFFLGNDAPEDFGAAVPYDLPFSMPLRKYIAFYHALQDTEPVGRQINQGLSVSPNEVLAELQATLTTDDPPGIVLMSPDRKGGHTVLPYSITNLGNGIHRVFVYDNNSPGDLDRWLEFDNSGNTWRSNLEGNIGDWEGDADSHNIGLLPVSWLDTALYPPQCPWCNSNLEPGVSSRLNLFAGGPAELLITDTFGRRIGYSETEDGLINELPGADYFVPLTGIGFLPANFYLPITQTYTIDLHADTAGSTDLVQFGPGYAIGANNVAVTAATADQLTISNDGTEVVYRSSAEKEIDLFIARDGVDESYQFTVMGSDLATNDVVELGADFAGKVLTLSHAQGSAGVYDLELSYTDASGNTVTFISYDVSIDAQATQFIEFSSVLNDETVTVCTDLDSDGTIDECETRENELSGSVYLPIMTGMP